MTHRCVQVSVCTLGVKPPSLLSDRLALTMDVEWRVSMRPGSAPPLLKVEIRLL